MSENFLSKISQKIFCWKIPQKIFFEKSCEYIQKIFCEDSQKMVNLLSGSNKHFSVKNLLINDRKTFCETNFNI